MIRNTPLYRILVPFSQYEAKPLLTEIKSRKIDDIVRTALVNYLIIRTVTVCEMFLLNQAHRLAIGNPNKVKKILPKIDPNVPIEVQLLRKYGYMRLEHIDRVFSTLLDKHFLAEIKAESIRYAPEYYIESVHIRYTKPLHKNWNKVVKIFLWRHHIVHQNARYRLKYSEIRNLVGGIIQFLLCSIMVTNQN